MISNGALKVVIFDYDGVIANSDPFTRYAIGESLKQKGIEFTEEIYKEYFAGRKLLDSFTLLLGPLDRLQEIDEFVALKKTFDSVYIDHVISYPDAIELVKRLKGKYRLAIATGSRRVLIDIALKKFNLENIFESIICAEDYKIGKPDPEIYLTTLKKMNVSPEEAFVIEDTPSGISSSMAAHITCVAVTHTHSAIELKDTKFVVDSLLDPSLSQFFALENF